MGMRPVPAKRVWLNPPLLAARQEHRCVALFVMPEVAQGVIYILFNMLQLSCLVRINDGLLLSGGRIALKPTLRDNVVGPKPTVRQYGSAALGSSLSL